MNVKVVRFHTRFDPILVQPTENTMESMTKQSFKDDCDINVLFKRFVKENGCDPLDIPVAIDYKAPINALATIKNMSDVFEVADMATDVFMQLPAEVRKQYDNDPAKLRNAVEGMSDADLQKIFGKEQVNETQTQSPEVQKDIPQDSPACSQTEHS